MRVHLRIQLEFESKRGWCFCDGIAQGELTVKHRWGHDRRGWHDDDRGHIVFAGQGGHGGAACVVCDLRI